jgi:hypothetical protein
MILELHSALRSIWRSKRFAITALITFSFGIGATATVFSVLDAVLLHPATFPDAGSVISLQYSEKHADWDALPPAAFHRIALRRDLFSETAAARTELFTITRVPLPDQVFGLGVSGEYFRMLDAKPLLGRVLLPEDDFLANHRRKSLLPLCRHLLQIIPPRNVDSIQPRTCSRCVWQCPRCGGSMLLMQRFTVAELQSQSTQPRIHVDSS